MIASSQQEAVAYLEDMIASASRVVPFTGAGISTECGIPDFRSPGGLWTRNRPIPYDEFIASPDARNEAWRRRFAMQPTFAAARPGRGHLALAALHKSGKVPAVITQNIDNLHQQSGFAPDAVCIGCGLRHELDWAKQRFDEDGLAPSCVSCNEPVKTATVSFGQAMPDVQMRRAAELARNCNLFLAIGSSLVVWPAAGFPLLARNAGARLVIINREPTDLDDIADLVIRHDIGDVLGGFVAH